MRAGSPFLVSGVLLCLFIALVQVQGQKKLYGVSLDTSSRNNDKLYPLQTSTIGGGSIENFTTNARVQYGSFGISSIDQKQGIYYFSDGYAPAKIFATDLKNKVALPTTHLSDVDYVTDFNFDNVNNRLLLFYSRNRTATLASFQDGKLTDLWKPQFLGITNTGFDEEGQRLVMITNATGPLSFTVLDLATQQTNSFALSDECQELVFLPTGKLVWSPTQKKAYSFAFGRNPHTNQVWDTYATVIDPAAESCEPVLIQVPFGYIMDWAIDASSDTIYFTQLINYGYLYFHYDINTQVVLYAAVLSPRLVEPLSIAVGPSYSVDDNAEVSIETLSPTVTNLVGKALRNGL